MPPRQHQRRKPFSGKQKKEQLKDKRKRKQGHDDSDDDGSEEVSKRYEDEYDPRKASSSKGSEVPLHVSLGRSGHVNKLSTVFAKETDNSVRQRKALATFPIDATARYMGTDDVHQILRLGNHDSEEWKSTMQGRVKDYHRQKQISKQLPYIHAANFAPHIRKHFLMGDADDDKQEQQSFVLGMPLSQFWTKKQYSGFMEESFEYNVESEKLTFDAWLNAIYSHYDRTELNQFEHNIEVWRQVRDRLALHCSTVGTVVWFGLFVQLWHVLEHSTVIALVADARNPLFHVEPSLYHAVCHLMNKRMFVILNKADLVPEDCITAWKNHLHKAFPLLEAVIPFTANAADCKLDDSLSQRRRNLSQAHKTFDERSNQSRAASAKELLRYFGLSEDTVGQVEDRILKMTTQTFKTGGKTHSSKQSAPSRRNRRGDLEKEAENIEKMAMAAAGTHVASLDEESDEEGNDDSEEDIEPGDDQDEDESRPRVNHGERLLVGMIGHPNVGKSSVINLLAGRKKVSVSRTAGHTKHYQNVSITNDMEVLDCPGLTFPHSVDDFCSDDWQGLEHVLSSTLLSVAMQHCLGVIPLAQVRECYTAVRFLAERLPLEKWYGLTLPDDWDYLLTLTDAMPTELKEAADQPEVVDGTTKSVLLRWSAYSICDAYASKRGMLIAKTGAPDAHAAGRSMLYDTVDGVVPLFFWPPTGKEE